MIKRWGWHLPILWGKQWKVKLLYFKSGGSISYQRHFHRAELWLFVFGKGLMRIGENTFYKCSGGISQSVARCQWHQYTAKRRTLVIEIQYGGTCAEDDIERRDP